VWTDLLFPDHVAVHSLSISVLVSNLTCSFVITRLSDIATTLHYGLRGVAGLCAHSFT